MKAKCKHCTWYQVGGVWTSICQNQNSEWCGEECVEKDKKEPQECDDKEE